jgi:lipopolysaccharide biosynthesis glycosyltransferase
MNLIYVCVFHQESYVQLLKLLIGSISKRANFDKETTDLLIITSSSMKAQIEKEILTDLPLQFFILELHSLFEAGCARLNIFKYNNIHKYDNILYLDTDILLNSDINVLFRLEISSEKVYALEEGEIGHEFWGGQFFDFTTLDRKLSAFTSGILFFKNSESMKFLFDAIQLHITDYKNMPVPICLDQPFIVYQAITQCKYDNQVLKRYVENNPSTASPEKIIYHFPGGPGNFPSKFYKMTDFWQKQCHAL